MVAHESRRERGWSRGAWLLPALLLLAPSVTATTGGFIELPTAATDNAVYAAEFAIGLSVNAGQSWQGSASISQDVLIKGSIDPAPEHVGGLGDIFVVELYANQWTMLTVDGTWVPWSTKLADLQPAWENVTLAATQDVTIFEGKIATSGQHRMFIGYLPASSPALIYTHTAASFEFSATVDPQTYFEEEIFDAIVMPKCSLCHVDGGLAGASSLHFIRDASLAQENFDIFTAFYAQQQPAAYDYILTKVTGGNGHGGGVQLPVGGSDYQKMEAFLGLLEGDTGIPDVSAITLFDGVQDQLAVDTLRDAALLLAGRLPTSAETASVAAGGENNLRAAVLALMQGEHFHKFLKDAANDRLFIRGNEDFNLADDCPYCFPAMNAQYFSLVDAGSTAAANLFMRQLNYSVVEAPLELIAYVVEQDKPWSEILTADYTMLTKLFNSVAGGTAVFASDAADLDFQPGRIEGYYLNSSSLQVQAVTGAPFPKIISPGMQTSYPHVGVLNSKSFLSRYPSTPTNRNRARARWTWYNFLGVDVEALAKRTTDPVALADTNNPTMNNPACTVCHSVLDPVAGTFQDYGDNGTYKVAPNGTDSLDRIYKATSGLYQIGDTWYADMREPGFDGALATTSNTTRWLAEQIVNDARFAVAAVRFWWPAMMGAELLKAPEVATDLDYAARLAAFEAQQDEIEALTESFVQAGLSPKALLADMALSRWYRAQSLDGSAVSTVQGDARALASLTGEKLLTPEQLARKTRALTGFNWYARNDTTTLEPLSGLENDYNTFYGGIDSFALKIRAREITPMMSNVAAAHALESTCPIVLGDFIRPDAERLLFDGLSPWTTPLTEGATTQTLTSTGTTDFKAMTMALNLQPGAKKLVMSELNDACDYATNANQCRANKNMVIASISILNPAGQTTTLSGSAATFGNCAQVTSGTQLTLYSSCTAEYSFTAATSGTYTITASLAAAQNASDPVLAGMNVEANLTPSASTAAGASALQHKLVELHDRLLGQTLTTNSPELLASYDLLLQTWQERRAGGFAPSLLTGALACDWSRDVGFIGTLSYPGNPLQANGNYSPAVTTWLGPQAQDPLYMKQSWAVVMAYMLSHYDYLHE